MTSVTTFDGEEALEHFAKPDLVASSECDDAQTDGYGVLIKNCASNLAYPMLS